MIDRTQVEAALARWFEDRALDDGSVVDITPIVEAAQAWLEDQTGLHSDPPNESSSPETFIRPMIDRTLLTEALALHKKALPALALAVDASVFDHYSAIAMKLDEAARLLLDFPTDQQVEAANTAMAAGAVLALCSYRPSNRLRPMGMIDRTQLTEAVETWDDYKGIVWQQVAEQPYAAITRAFEAADWVLDFPTDQQVEAANTAMAEYDAAPQEAWTGKGSARAALEAVRDTMIDDG